MAVIVILGLEVDCRSLVVVAAVAVEAVFADSSSYWALYDSTGCRMRVHSFADSGH